jgi:RNA polymerase subunit RPABC4/transcription elongation factor Spt4
MKKNKHCKKCNKLIWNTAKYCKSCYSKFIRPKQITGQNNPNYKFGKYCFNKCIDCNKFIKAQRQCCKLCHSKWRKKYFVSNHNPNWQGGIGREPYSFDFYKIRIKILQRDKQLCQLCNQKGNTIHHVDYCKQNNVITNLITLCTSCNAKANGCRDYWYAYFSKLLQEKL